MLVKIKVADQKIHVNHKRVDVGFASEKLKGTGSFKPSEKQVMEFRMESNTCLIQLLAGFSTKSSFYILCTFV